MRKILAIALLFVFLLYNTGYYLFYLTIRYQVEYSWRLSVENQSLDMELLQTRSIPITFAYQQDMENEMPTLQAIDINGEHYRVVKQHYSKDTLHIVYIQDRNSKNLDNSLRDWVRSISQEPGTDKQNPNKIFDSLEKNYLPNSIAFALPAASQSEQKFGNFFDSGFESRFLDVASPPPKA